ncbi:MAG: hypothetical protein KAR20_12995 [Candidatus Heimdallarchaeota archaeon]|nr:hypothetical protein [Candidatus Heimdallarchaeota archaeon]
MKKRKVFKKKLEDFIKDESGNISRDKVLKIGLGTIAALGIMAAMTSDMASAHTNHTSHNNSNPVLGPNTGGTYCGLSHINTNPHTNHSSY